MKQLKFRVDGMDCTSCETLLREDLEDAGCIEVEVSAKTGSVKLKYDELSIDKETIRRVITRNGFKV